MPRRTSRSVFALICFIAAATITAAPSAYADKECEFQWTAFDSSLTPGQAVPAMVVFDDGTGPSLYATHVNQDSDGGVRDVAKWDGSGWSRLGVGTDRVVKTMAVFDDGTGPALYVGGTFLSAGGEPARRIAKWDGASWSALGDGVGSHPHGSVSALAVFDDGTGPALYAAGSLAYENHIMKWDGVSWSTLGEGLDGSVSVLAVFDDGSGPALYAGGDFLHAGGKPANHIAKWDGASWSALGSGMSEGILGNTWMSGLTVFDDGNGPALYATGNFHVAGGETVNHIARWDGDSWSALGAGLSSSGSAVAVFDDGGGSALYVGGGFFEAGGQLVNHIAKWQGGSWSPLGGPRFNNGGKVGSLLVYDDGSGPSLLAGGAFAHCCFEPMARLALWKCTDPRACREDLNRDGTVDLADLNVLLADFGTEQICGDANNDGVVDLIDLNIVLAAFGNACKN